MVCVLKALEFINTIMTSMLPRKLLDAVFPSATLLIVTTPTMYSIEWLLVYPMLPTLPTKGDEGVLETNID
jgi:hypothetical protein